MPAALKPKPSGRGAAGAEEEAVAADETARRAASAAAKAPERTERRRDATAGAEARAAGDARIGRLATENIGGDRRMGRTRPAAPTRGRHCARATGRTTMTCGQREPLETNRREAAGVDKTCDLVFCMVSRETASRFRGRGRVVRPSISDHLCRLGTCNSGPRGTPSRALDGRVLNVRSVASGDYPPRALRGWHRHLVQSRHHRQGASRLPRLIACRIRHRDMRGGPINTAIPSARDLPPRAHPLVSPPHLFLSRRRPEEASREKPPSPPERAPSATPPSPPPRPNPRPRPSDRSFRPRPRSLARRRDRP